MQSLTIAAFTAGLVSFLSPCVLPLVPGYISLISGAGIDDLKQGEGKLMRSIMLNSVLFVLGFSVVFLVLGAVASTLGQLVRQHIGLLSRIAGAVIIVLGFHQTGLLPIRMLYADNRFHKTPAAAGGARAFLMGSAFAFGWTPCVGPILAVILTFAAAQSTLSKGVSLLAVYALGLALPFFLTALSIDGFLAFYKRFQRHLHTLEVTAGVVMIGIGGLIFTGRFVMLNDWMNRISFFRSMAERFL
ncbi:MAG TPA: cytochrome c biogenesis protein CcdA [Terriglobales bacterium]|nr:cytochrome c biogenesis protein CcdA [Terriglobales bacterium]